MSTVAYPRAAKAQSPYASGLTNPIFVNNGVNPGTTYYYTVAAADFSGEGAHSTQASATIAGQLAVTNTDITSLGSSGTLELAGSVSEYSSSTNLTNNSTAADGILVTGTNQIVGNVTGTGNLVIAPGGYLTASSIVQNTLVIGAGGTLTIAPSGGSTNASAAASSAVAADSTSDAATSSAIAVAAAAPVVEPLAAAQVIASSADAIAPVVAPIAIAVSSDAPFAPQTVTPVVLPTITPTATPTASLAPAVVSQPTAPAAINVPTMAVASAPLVSRVATSNPSDSVAQLLARTELGTAMPLFTQFVAGQPMDQNVDETGASLSFAAKNVANSTGMTTVSEPLSITPLGAGAESLLNVENATDSIDPGSNRDAMEAIFADGDIAARVDDALLNLLANEAGNRD